MSETNNNKKNASERVQTWLTELEQHLKNGGASAVANLFTEDCFWRDLVSFTWNIKTAEGKEQIKDMVEATVDHVSPMNWKIDGEASESDGVTEGWFHFETDLGRGKGMVRLKDGKCWTLLTTLAELKGYEEKQGKKRVQGVAHGSYKSRLTWKESIEKEQAELGYSKQPYCLIIGGGQGGIAIGARLRMLEVPTIIVEKNERAGDSWRNRYKSLCLHDPVWYDHLPYLPFPKHWPVFSPKDKLGDWLEMYTKIMELNYWNSTFCKSAKYDSKKEEWEVHVIRKGREVFLRPKHLIFATGMSGKPNIPKFPGANKFKGEQHHSSRHDGGKNYKGKKCVVIGSNNSAHDICAALWENGADVTMVQKSSTHIVRSEPLMEHALGDLYSERALENGIDHHKADLIFASVPYKIMHEFHIPAYEKIAEEDAEFYKKLEKAGFMLDWGDDGSGLFMKYLRRGSGYYIDVGACDLVIDGSIKLKSNVNIQKINENSLTLSDGSELPADVIVYATGYQSMNGWVADLVSKEIADKVGKCWGLGSSTRKDPGPWEGELRNMWKPTQQEGLWFHGGNLHQSRHYSKLLSLQLKARMENLPTPVYGLAEVHHLS